MGGVEAGGPVGVALIGSGRMGSFHGSALARQIPGARLVAVADPVKGAAERLATDLGADRAYTDPAEVFADKAVDAVVIAAPARFHADLVVAAAAAAKGVFCEKPMALSLADADRAIDAALRFLNPGAEAVSVYATANALVEPEWRERGLLDTAVVTVKFDNGAIGVAEACFEAAYGYDVRGEVLGSGGMATMGDGRRTGMAFSGATGRIVDTVRGDQELLAGAYVAELAAFVEAVRAGTPAQVDGEDARAALVIALAAAESVRTARPVAVEEIAK